MLCSKHLVKMHKHLANFPCFQDVLTLPSVRPSAKMNASVADIRRPGSREKGNAKSVCQYREEAKSKKIEC